MQRIIISESESGSRNLLDAQVEKSSGQLGELVWRLTEQPELET